MTDRPKVAVLLSTYNGSAFLAEQLDSLFQQTYTHFILVARDDGSDDASVDILRQYQSQHPQQIHLVDAAESRRNLGASASFSFLVDYVLAHKEELGLQRAYMFFCDQDDVWCAEKIEQELLAMQQAESGPDGTDKPVLVHSELRVVDERKNLIAESFTRYQGLEIDRNSFCNLVISNLVTGCTAVINEALARKALPVPGQAIMHDWWMAMVATAFGELVFVDQPLVHYRQHEANTIGAREHKREETGIGTALLRLLSLQVNEHLLEVAEQAAVFLARYSDQLSTHNRKGLQLASRMKTSVGLLQRINYRRARRY